MPSLAHHCPKCKHYSIIEDPQGQISCPNCGKEWGKVTPGKDIFEECPFCPCRQFYTSKDFNQFLGCTIMLIGIVLVPWTYGISLPVFYLIDLFLVRRVKTLINCYRCGCEFRGYPKTKDFKPFLHHIGLKYDKYR